MEMPKRQSSCLLTDKSNAWKYLAGIKLSSLQPNVVAEDFYEEPETIVGVENNEPEVYTVSNTMSCSLCDCTFEDRHQQKAHYRLDWHRFNLKQRMSGLKSLSEEAFSQRADDLSSISGSGDSSSSSSDEDMDMSPISRTSRQVQRRRKRVSSIHKYDSDDDDGVDGGKEGGNSRRCPRIYFDNDDGEVVSVYRCIIHGKREAPSSHTELISRTLGLLTNQKWAIIMTGGGHFAAALYDGPDVIVHKTFHRYTVRAKRGTVQSVKDAQGSAAKSAGASIRRHNEAALNQEVQDLLASWKDHLDACTRIFLRVPAYNRAMFYGGKCPALVKGDCRVVTIPFATRRATFKELKRVWEVLATVECHGSVPDVSVIMASPKEKKEWKKGKKPSKNQEKEDGESLEVILSRLEEQSLEDEHKEERSDNSTSLKSKENKLNEEEEARDFDLVEEVVVTTTDHLKDYDVASKKQRKRKKKKKPERHIPQEDKEEENLTIDLYTICRTCNTEKLEEILQKIHQHFSTTPSGNSKNLTRKSLDHEKTKGEKVSPDNHDQSPGVGCEDDCSISREIQNSLPPDNDNLHPDIGSRKSIPPSDAVDNSCQSSSSDTLEHSHNNISGNTNWVECGLNLPESLDSPGDRVMKVVQTNTQDNTDRVDDVEGTPFRPELCVESNIDATNLTKQPEQLPEGNPGGGEDKAARDADDKDKHCPGVLKFLNKSLDDLGYTFLHVAAEDGQCDISYRLMECGADPGVKNKKGKPAYGCSFDKKTRETFRRFRSFHPERYDYERAQIPAPLTEEQEREKSAKQSERKRNARKAKRLKEKEQKEVKEAERKENEKKEWYAKLSDREKRALAAEKRFAQQVSSSSDMQRCWSCGASLAGKTPFSYMDFKFCSMPCLKKHKQQP
nr:ankyrin repeat and zinc finger domain-containing protein 1-like [Lytechinus pictus]